MMNALLVLLTGAALIAFYYFQTFSYWKKRGVNTLRPNLLFGNISGCVRRKVPVYRMFKEVYETCKKTGDKFMGFYFLNMPNMVIVDIDLVKQIFTKDFGYFTDRPFYLNEEDPLTINIVSAKGNQWRTMRDQLTPAFSPSKLKNVCHTLQEVGEQLKSVLDKSAENFEVLNIQNVVCKYIVDAMGMSIFGIECNTLQNFNKEFNEFAENTFGGSLIQNIKTAVSALCPSLLVFFKIPLFSYNIQNFYLQLVKSTVEYREKNKVVRKDLMHSLIQLRNNIDIENEAIWNLGNVSEEEKSMKIEEITAQVLIFFGAGYESSVSTVSLCLYELGANVDIQNKLREEILSVLKKYEGKLCYDAIMEMTYLDKCLTETLRKYAIAGMTARRVTECYKLPNTDIVLDVGSTVYIPIYEIHHDPQFYPNPEEFDPERFSPENKLARPSYTFLAFGEGQRSCIGSRLGSLQVKIFLATFLSNYNFTFNWKCKLPPTLHKTCLVVCLEHPLYLNIEKI